MWNRMGTEWEGIPFTNIYPSKKGCEDHGWFKTAGIM
jgi:hypothetical protein